MSNIPDDHDRVDPAIRYDRDHYITVTGDWPERADPLCPDCNTRLFTARRIPGLITVACKCHAKNTLHPLPSRLTVPGKRSYSQGWDDSGGPERRYRCGNPDCRPDGPRNLPISGGPSDFSIRCRCGAVVRFLREAP